MKNKTLSLAILIIFTITLYVGQITPFVLAQEKTRGLKPIEYAQYLPKKYADSRPKKKTASKKQTKLPKYKYKVENNKDALVFDGKEIGVTIWRLREAKKTDDTNIIEKTRIIKRVKGQTTEVVTNTIPERISSDTELANGDIIRFAVEVPTEGYIYIISQELYINGKYSEPYLVFPSRRDIGKIDRVVSGKLLFIPNEVDYFEISSLKDADVEISEEVFTIIVVQDRLTELPPLENDEPRKLDLNEFQGWKEKWGGQVLRFEQETSANLAITQVEKNATANGNKVLSQTDLLPQTIYHVANKDEKTLLFTTSVKIKK